jgi:hypothetical protein
VRPEDVMIVIVALVVAFLAWAIVLATGVMV